MNESTRPNVIFIADETAGPGPVMRVLAMALRMTEDVSPYLVTLSDQPVRSFGGVAVENIPSWRELTMDRDDWFALTAGRIRGIVGRLRPVVVVTDTPEPSVQIADALAGRSTVWVRSGAGSSELADRFDHILEPLDLASGFDPQTEGSPLPDNPNAIRPVSLVDSAEMVSRDDARRALGVAAHGHAIVVNLPAASSDAIRRLVTRVRDEARKWLPDTTVVVPAERAAGMLDLDGVVVRPAFPLGRYLHAFDAAIATADYETFHEAVLSATPTIFVTDGRDSTDGELWRAKAAATGGFGLHVEDVDSSALEWAIRQVLDPSMARQIRTAAVAAHPGNGATDAARLLVHVAQGGTLGR